MCDLFNGTRCAESSRLDIARNAYHRAYSGYPWRPPGGKTALKLAWENNVFGTNTEGKQRQLPENVGLARFVQSYYAGLQKSKCLGTQVGTEPEAWVLDVHYVWIQTPQAPEHTERVV
jgi:hypothetical protein